MPEEPLPSCGDGDPERNAGVRTDDGWGDDGPMTPGVPYSEPSVEEWGGSGNGGLDKS